MDAGAFASKTLGWEDLAQPEVVRVAGELRRFALRLAFAGTPFAVNGVLRRRFWVRRHKLWEYARGVACVMKSMEAREAEEAEEAEEEQEARRQGGKEIEQAKEKATRVLDFGGGATLPVYYLAHRGCDVLSVDTNPELADWTNRVGHARGWELRGSTHDLAESPPQADSGQFDAVISFSVLEHIAKERQQAVLERLAHLLKPGGVFALTFDYGTEAPVEGAIRNAAEVGWLVAATGLAFLDGRSFTDTGERFVLDKRYPNGRFTFGSLFLRKGKD